MKKLLIAVVIFFFLIYGVAPTNMGSANPDDIPVVSPGADPTAILLGYTKFRNFTTENSWEIFLGLESATGSSHDATWDAQNNFIFKYDKALDKLSITIDNTLGVWSYDYLNYSTQVLNLKGALAHSYLNALNYLQMRIVVENHATTAVNLTGVMLDGQALGNFSGTPGSSLDWMVTGYDLSAGFTLSGTLVFSGINSKSPEKNLVEVFFGRVDHKGPVSSNLIASPNPVGLNAPMGLNATVDDSTTGLSTIVSAEYRLGLGGTWEFMSAQDGSFDESSENVVANFNSPNQHGIYDLCVRGTDSVPNQGSATCISLNVDGEGPLTEDVLLLPNRVGATQTVTVTATISDTSTGGSLIYAAEYSLDAGANWDPMQAEDGAFDEVVEPVTATFPASDQSGTYNICVRGADSLANQGNASCQQLVVDGEGPLTNSIHFDPNPVITTHPVTVTATISDISTGGSLIYAAEYSLDAGANWHPMQAEDGTFDEVVELVEVTFTAPDPEGTYQVCVRGQDDLGNIGTEACANLTVNPPEPIFNYIYLPLISKDSP